MLVELALKARATELTAILNGCVMNPQQTDEEILTYEVSDDALETAGAAIAGGAVTLIQGSYCFTCGRVEQRKPNSQS
jgi:hypothetical protein